MKLNKTTQAFLYLILFCSSAVSAQIAGDWNGEVTFNGTKLGFLISVSETDNGLKTEVSVPKQGPGVLEANETTFQDSVFTFKIESMSVFYEGTMSHDQSIAGTFKQGGFEVPLTLTRGVIELNRPQEPKPPYPYNSSEISFTNKKANIKLSGTFTSPSEGTAFPAVILIAGSGPQNRNSEIFGHKSFLVISDYLTRKGFAVLRFDERGNGKSEGNFDEATSFDLASDVEAGIKYLRSRDDIDKSRISLIGHSEGGVIAPIVASKDKKIGSIVLLAGPGMKGSDLLLLQKKLISEESGVSDKMIETDQQLMSSIYSIINSSKKSSPELEDTIRKKFRSVFPGLPDQQVENIVSQLTATWMYAFLRLDPKEYLKKVKCPVLALNGTRDLQVPFRENLDLIKQTLNRSGNENVDIVELENLNHLFQHCETGLPGEYAEIEETFSEGALEEISSWLLNKVK